MKIILSFIIFAITAIYVRAYDWTDSDFNVILRHDLEDSIDFYEDQYELPHNRKVRGVNATEEKPADNNSTEKCRPSSNRQRPPQGNNGFQRSCCGNRDDLKMHGDALKEIRRECFSEMKKARSMRSNDTEHFDIFNCEKVMKSKDEMVCVMECVARKKNLVDIHGDITPNSTSIFIKTELVSQEWQKKIIDSVLEKCYNSIVKSNISTNASSSSVSEMSLAKDEPKALNANCNPSSLKFSHCLWREMQLSCPSDQIRDSRSCQRMRERLQNKEFPDLEKPRGPSGNRNQSKT